MHYYVQVDIGRYRYTIWCNDIKYSILDNEYTYTHMIYKSCDVLEMQPKQFCQMTDAIVVVIIIVEVQ